MKICQDFPKLNMLNPPMNENKEQGCGVGGQVNAAGSRTQSSQLRGRGKQRVPNRGENENVSLAAHSAFVFKTVVEKLLHV